jgi:hypothetical protein
MLKAEKYESFRFFQFHGSDDLDTAEADSKNENASNKSNLSCGGFSSLPSNTYASIYCLACDLILT